MMIVNCLYMERNPGPVVKAITTASNLATARGTLVL